MINSVQGLWIGDQLSPIEELCIRSFQYHGHEFHLYAYQPLKNVPSGVIMHDANDIVPAEKIYRSDGGRLSSFANMFRWVLLNARGGQWVDMDMICLKPFDFTDEIVFGFQDERTVNTAVLRFPKGHILTTIMKKVCDDVNIFQPIDTPKSVAKKIVRKVVFGKEKSRARTRFTEPGGPDYFTKFLVHYDLLQYAKPVNWFYPISSKSALDVFASAEKTKQAVKESYAVHLWNGALGHKSEFDEGGAEESLFDQLRAQYS